MLNSLFWGVPVYQWLIGVACVGIILYVYWYWYKRPAPQLTNGTDEGIEMEDLRTHEVGENNSKVILTKTSQEWYNLDRTADIVDPVGWKDLENAEEYWHNNPITYKEFEMRRNVSIAVEFGENEHQDPFKKEL